MDFPPDPFLLLSHFYYNPFVISLFTPSPFHLLFTPQSTAIVRFSLFRSNSYLVVRVPSLDHNFLLPLYICVCSSFISGFSLSRHLILYLFHRSPSRSLFSSRFSLACRFLLSSSPRTKSINSFTSLTPLTSLLFSLPCTLVKETTLTPNLIACHVLPHSSPQRPIVLTLAYFLISYRAGYRCHSFTYPPFPKQFPSRSPYIRAHLQPPTNIQSGHNAAS